MKLTIPEVPVPWRRAGYNRNHQRFFNTQKELQQYHQYLIKQQLPAYYKPYNNEPLYMHLLFCMPIPKSKYKEIPRGSYHYKKPDTSNLIKYIEDVCIGILYTDDRIIACTTATKIYDHKPRTIITLNKTPNIHTQFDEEGEPE